MSQVPPTLFYFPSAEALKQFTRFEAVRTSNDRQGCWTELWSVAAYDKITGKYTIIAEFHAQCMAETFRDMCVIVSS